jgi:UDP-glucose:(heptosyl)LPS alpha-1,3-glucosyltransferase
MSPNQPMKVALIRARYSPYGGAERFAMRAMQALSDQGAEVTIIARRWVRVEEQPGLGPTGLPGVRMLTCNPFYLGSLWRDVSFARAVQRLLAHTSFDLIQSHERIVGLPVYRAGDGVHAAWLERRAATLHSPWKKLSLRLNPHHRWLLRTERDMFEHPQLRAVICNSHMVRDEILQRFIIDPDKLHVIANGVDIERFHPSVRERYRAPMRRQLGIAPDVPVLVFVGSGFERKGLALTLRALAQMRTVKAATLVIVGGDKRSAAYQELACQLGIAPAVRFVGEQSDVLPYYGMADAFILPTLYDPFPNAALEALACGLPIIVSEACGAKEVVVEGQTGWVCSASNVNSLSRLMLLASQGLTDPERRLIFQTAARAVAEQYSLAELGKKLHALYAKLI